MTKLERLARKADALLDARQRARLDELNVLERLLFLKLIDDLKGTTGTVAISKAVDALFDAIRSRNLREMAGSIAGDMRELLALNANYYRVLAVNKGHAFDVIAQKVDATMRRRLGIDPEGGANKRGFLDNLFSTEAARNEVKKMVLKGVASGIPQKKLKQAIEVFVTGNYTDEAGRIVKTENAGVLERSLGGAIQGAYRAADNITNNAFAERLWPDQRRYFIYSGGLIETSREFCIEKNGKVFTTEEALRDWPVDCKLPRTKAEREAFGNCGAPPAYVPLEELGRWDGTSEVCRHRVLYISDEEAFRRRPDLRPAKAAK